jgi:pimeloyl-ACP methyl ester carboxylesterase
MAISELYSQSWKTIISPPAARHPASCLGPSSQLLQNCPITQLPLSVTSTRNSLLSGFLSFSPDHSHPDLIIYLHGSGGSKLDAMSLIQCIPKYNVAIAAFDFAGCGNSEKQYITYGRY